MLPDRVRGHGVPTCRSPAVRTALHVLRSLKLPSVSLHPVECTFQRGFDSFRAHHPLRSMTYRLNHLSIRSSHFVTCASGTEHCRLSGAKLDSYGRNRLGAFVPVQKSDFGCCGLTSRRPQTTSAIQFPVPHNFMLPVIQAQSRRFAMISAVIFGSD